MALSDANITGLYFLAGTIVTVLGAVVPSWLRDRRARLKEEARDKATILRDKETADSRTAIAAAVAEVKGTVEVVKAGVDGMTTKLVKAAATEARADEKAVGQDTAAQVAEAVRVATLAKVVDEAVNGVHTEGPAA